jgi:hypothetical protein
LPDGAHIAEGHKTGHNRLFRNSANNPLNPDPTKSVRWGEPSNEEMMGFWLAFAEDVPQTPKQQVSRLRTTK